MDYLVTKEYVKLLGRTSFKDNIRYLSYSCSGIEFEMIGRKAEVVLWTDGARWEKDLKAWMAVFINDEEIPSKRFCLEQEEAQYVLFESNQVETVKIKLIKYSEAAFAKVGIKTLSIEGQVPIPTLDKDLKIEFIGDSITCGYGNEGQLDVDCFNTIQENPYLAYAAKTARALDADYHLVSWSGIGILSSWVEENMPIRRDPLMPKLYPYTNLALEEVTGEKLLWNFSEFQPDYVVIHLGTNDASYTQGIKEREAAFEATYYQFLLMVRMYHPKAYIICALGGIDTKLYPIIEKAVESFMKTEDDRRITCFKFENQIEEDGIGTDSHPSLITHEKMKCQLVQKLQNIMCN